MGLERTPDARGYVVKGMLQKVIEPGKDEDKEIQLAADSNCPKNAEIAQYTARRDGDFVYIHYLKPDSRVGFSLNR